MIKNNILFALACFAAMIGFCNLLAWLRTTHGVPARVTLPLAFASGIGVVLIVLEKALA